MKEIDREIEKYQLTDKKILELKKKLHEAIIQSDEWKEKYLIIKRFEEKKLKEMILEGRPEEILPN